MPSFAARAREDRNFTQNKVEFPNFFTTKRSGSLFGFRAMPSMLVENPVHPCHPRNPWF